MMFVELAKLVGARWSMQSSNERSTWISKALEAKLLFEEQLRPYKETPEYSQYQQYLQGFKNRHKPSYIDKNSEPTRKVTLLGALNTQRQQLQTTVCATDHNIQSEERTRPEVDQCVETKHSIPASLLRTDCASPNLAELTGNIEEYTSPFPSASTMRLEKSQYFRTVLHI
jgi:hypothetical protein